MTYTAGTLVAYGNGGEDIPQIDNRLVQIADTTNVGNLHVFALTTDGVMGKSFCLKNETGNEVRVKARFAQTPVNTWDDFYISDRSYSIERVIEVKMYDDSAFPTGLKVAY